MGCYWESYWDESSQSYKQRQKCDGNSGGETPPSSGTTTTEKGGSKVKVVPTHTRGYKASLRNYVDYVRWQREEMLNMLKRYRTEYPKQIEAFKASATNALETQAPKTWGNMYTNLNQRGLDESASFVGGARNDYNNWYTGEKGRIAETAQGMETAAQQAILAAIGRPNYGAVYDIWGQLDRETAEYINYLNSKKS